MHAQILSAEEKKCIHEDAMRILEEIGIKFPSEKALDILEKGGARIDRENEIAYISRQMVAAALKTTPKSVMLHGRSETYDFDMPSSFTAYHLDGCGMSMVDMETGKRRTAVLQDLADAARIFDEMDLGYIYWPPVSPSDVPYEVRSIAATATGFSNTSKHVQDEMKTAKEIPYVMEIIRAILGGDKREADKNIYSVVYCTVSPLCHDQDMLEANIELSKYKVPIVVLPMPACTTTGPASLYTNTAMANAEALSALVMFQMAAPGVPIIYASSHGTASATNGLFLFGAPETSIQLMAMIEMGKYYNLPVTIAGGTTDAKGLGSQAILEKVTTTLPLVLAGADTIVGYGMYECSTTLSLSQIIIDNEMAGYCKRIRDGLAVSPEKDFFDDVKKVGHGGHFLKQKNTRAAVRSDEFYTPDLADRGSYDEWISLGSRDMNDIATEKAKQILAAEPKNPLSQNTEKVLREIIEEATRKFEE